MQESTVASTVVLKMVVEHGWLNCFLKYRGLWCVRVVPDMLHQKFSSKLRKSILRLQTLCLPSKGLSFSCCARHVHVPLCVCAQRRYVKWRGTSKSTNKIPQVRWLSFLSEGWEGNCVRVSLRQECVNIKKVLKTPAIDESMSIDENIDVVIDSRAYILECHQALQRLRRPKIHVCKFVRHGHEC